MIDDMGKSLPADLPFRTSTINPLNQIEITLITTRYTIYQYINIFLLLIYIFVYVDVFFG